MGFFDKVGSFFKREAKDLGDAAEDIKATFDQELTKREKQLEMTPSEKIAALQQQASATDARFDAIAGKASGLGALADAVAEVGHPPVDASVPSVTHIVLPDGRVRSGSHIEQVADDAGAAHDVPVVEAPTTEDLQKSDVPEATDIPAPPVTEPESAVERRLAVHLAEAKSVIDDFSTPPGGEPAIILDDLPVTAVADGPEPTSPEAEESPSEVDQSSPGYGKTPAQLNYERARAAANTLLDELRAELKDDGTI
jgi:ElaB/YqjD/DUF883 family membrane-anchored ribosome-binding protein